MDNMSPILFPFSLPKGVEEAGPRASPMASKMTEVTGELFKSKGIEAPALVDMLLQNAHLVGTKSVLQFLTAARLMNVLSAVQREHMQQLLQVTVEEPTDDTKALLGFLFVDQTNPDFFDDKDEGNRSFDEEEEEEEEEKEDN